MLDAETLAIADDSDANRRLDDKTRAKRRIALFILYKISLFS